MGNNLRQLRLRKKLTHDEAAVAMGVSRSQFIKLERGERRLTDVYIARAAAAFNVPEAEVINDNSPIEIAGFITSGGRVSLGKFQEEVPGAPRPPALEKGTVALVAEGTIVPNLLEDGWIVYYVEPSNGGVPEDLIGEISVLCLSDGEALIGRIYRGRSTGLYDVVPLALEMRRDQSVRWAAKVDWIKPR